MKKKIAALALGLLLCAGLTACGTESEDTGSAGSGSAVTATTEAGPTLQQEIISFVGDSLPSISGDRDRAVQLYNEYFSVGGEKDSDKWMTTLSQEALPKYDTYLGNLKALKTTNPEVESLKKLYLESAELQRDAIQLVVDAITNADSTILDQAQKKVDDSKVKLEEFNTQLKTLCEQNNITLEGIGE